MLARLTHRPHQPLLGNAGHQAALLAINRTTVKTARATGKGAVHGVQMPLIELDWRMKPHCMIQTGSHHPTLEPRQPVGPQRGSQKVHIGRIGQQAMLHLRRLTRGGMHAESQMIEIRRWLRIKMINRRQFAHLDRARPDIIFAVLLRNFINVFLA